MDLSQLQQRLGEHAQRVTRIDLYDERWSGQVRRIVLDPEPSPAPPRGLTTTTAAYEVDSQWVAALDDLYLLAGRARRGLTYDPSLAVQVQAAAARVLALKVPSERVSLWSLPDMTDAQLIHRADTITGVGLDDYDNEGDDAR